MCFAIVPVIGDLNWVFVDQTKWFEIADESLWWFAALGVLKQRFWVFRQVSCNDLASQQHLNTITADERKTEYMTQGIDYIHFAIYDGVEYSKAWQEHKSETALLLNNGG